MFNRRNIMPASFNAHNGLIDITFTWPNVPAALAQEIIFGSAFFRWRRGYGPTIGAGSETTLKPFADLTNQEKLNIAYRGAQELIIAEARSALVDTDVGAARDAALAYADANYELPE